MPSFGDRFKALREKKGWTQEDIAEKLGVSRPSIAGYETKNRTPRKELLSRIADLFGVTIDYLLGRDETNTQQEAAEKLLEYLELDLTNEEIKQNITFKVDNMTLNNEEMDEFINFVRVRRLMKKQQQTVSKSDEL